MSIFAWDGSIALSTGLSCGDAAITCDTLTAPMMIEATSGDGALVRLFIRSSRIQQTICKFAPYPQTGLQIHDSFQEDRTEHLIRIENHVVQ